MIQNITHLQHCKNSSLKAMQKHKPKHMQHIMKAFASIYDMDGGSFMCCTMYESLILYD
jgi:hypothetical protein